LGIGIFAQAGDQVELIAQFFVQPFDVILGISESRKESDSRLFVEYADLPTGFFFGDAILLAYVVSDLGFRLSLIAMFLHPNMEGPFPIAGYTVAIG
jgi:hypothetical protein